VLIDAVIDVIDAKLYDNNTSISSFSGISINPNKTKRGELFIAFDNIDIQTSIDNGAYGVIYSGSLQTLDNETAWLYVDDIKKSVHRLIKYLLVIEKKELYLVPPVINNILKSLSKDKKLTFIEDSYSDIIKKIKNKKVEILISTNAKFVNLIFQNPETIDNKNANIISSSMFRTTFSCSQTYFDNYKIAPHYIDDFASSLHFLKNRNLLFSIETEPCKSIFESIPITSNHNIAKSSDSAKTLIIQKDISSLDRDIEYLKNNAKWANILYCLPNKYKKQKQLIKNSLFFNKKSEIIEYIKHNSFDFCYILGLKSEDIYLHIAEQKPSLSLF
jgi:ferrochelatase